VYRAGGREAEARAAALRAIPLFLDLPGSNPDNPGAVQAKIGELYAAAGQWEQAAAAYRESIRLGGSASGLYLKLGEAYCAVGKTGEARAAYQKAIELEAPARLLKWKTGAGEMMDACLPVLEQ
jgi:tetratricopeptide (TPR) repeat protein